MRNLKRALSLALASVMLVGMMVVGTSAASYPDVDSNDNVEAISVLQAVEVMQGDADTGEFRPDDKVSRNEMAVIMARLMLGPDAEDYVGTHPFTDVPAWADKYVAACYNEGIIMGMDDTTYGGTSTITAEQAAAMMMRALGYEKLEGTGADWAKPVVAKANSISLFKGMGGNVKAELTRNQIAQLGLNTLKATVVESDVEKDIIIEGVASIPGKVTYNEVKVDGEGAKNYTDIGGTGAGGNAAGLGTLQLCEKLYGTGAKALKLTSAGSGDDFGRPATEWKYKNDSVVKAAEEPIAVFTAKTSEDDVLKAIKGYTFTDTSNSTYTVKVSDKTSKCANAISISGLSIGAGEAVVTAVKDETLDGKLVEIFATDNDVTKVVTVTYSVDKVKSITEKNGKTTYKFDTATPKTNDEDNTNVILEGDIAEGDVVTIANVSSKYYVYPTTSFTGNQTAIRAKDGTYTATIGGEKYVIGAGVTNVTTGDYTNSKDDATYYVDMNGFIVKVEDLEKTADEYAVITKVAAKATDATLDDGTGYNVNVRAVLADGTVADYKLAVAVTTEDDQWGLTGGSNAGSLMAGSGDTRVLVCGDDDLGTLQATATTNLVGTNGKLFAYSINDDDEMVLSPVTNTPANTSPMTVDDKYQATLGSYSGANNATVNTDKTVLFTKDTVFVLWSIDDDGKVTAETPKTGTADLSVSSLPGAAVVKASSTTAGTASLVFLKGESVAKEEDYVYIDASEYTTELDPADSKKQIKVWTGIAADGSEVDVHVASTVDTSSLKDGLYVYDTDGKLNTTAKVDVQTGKTTVSSSDLYNNALGTGAEVSENLLKIGSDYVNITSDTQIVYIKDDLSEVDGNKCLVVMESNDGKKPENVAAIFVFDEGDKPQIAATIPSTATIANSGTTGTISVTGITGGATYEITAESGNTSKATVSVTGTTVTVTRVGEAPADNDDSVTVTVTVTPTGDSADTYSAKSASVTVTIAHK